MTRFNSSLTGTGHVFRFTFLQFWKSRSNLISLALLLLFAVASLPVASLLGGGGLSLGAEGYEGVIAVVDESGLAPDFSAAGAVDSYFAPTRFVTVPEPDAVAVRLSAGAEGGCAVDVTVPAAAGYPVEQQDRLIALCRTLLMQARADALGLTAEQTARLTGGLRVDVEPLAQLAERRTGEPATSWDAAYFFQLFYAVAVMMLSLLSASYILRAVVEEKSSKLVELLMVSVRPLALIVGKIAAAMVYVLGVLALLILGFAGGAALSRLLGGDTAALLSGFGFSLSALRLDIPTLLAVIVSLLLAYLTFAIIAGVSGTGCSTMEEIGEANSGCSLLVMAGYLLSIVVGVSENATVTLLCSLLPVISVFCAPAQYILGNISFGVLALSWLLQTLLIVALARFCARVYQALLIHRGKRLKWRDMLALAGLTRKKEVA